MINNENTNLEIIEVYNKHKKIREEYYKNQQQPEKCISEKIFDLSVNVVAYLIEFFMNDEFNYS